MKRGGPIQRKPMKRGRVTKRSERSEFRSDALWRGEVMLAGGWRCASCGDSDARHLEADHIIPRSQGGLSDVANGLVLCGEFGKGRCHPRKTAGEIKIRPSWLRPEQITYLAEKGWVEWVEDTRLCDRDQRLIPAGRGWRHFEDKIIPRNSGDNCTDVSKIDP